MHVVPIDAHGRTFSPYRDKVRPLKQPCRCETVLVPVRRPIHCLPLKVKRRHGAAAAGIALAVQRAQRVASAKYDFDRELVCYALADR